MYLVSIYFDEKTTSRIQGYITQVVKKCLRHLSSPAPQS